MDRPVRLTTERLLLRLFTMDDVGDVLEYSKDPEWARYQKNIPPHPFSRKDASALVAMFSAPSNWGESPDIRYSVWGQGNWRNYLKPAG